MKLLLSIILCLFTSILYSQNTANGKPYGLSGVVKDSVTGDVIPYATVEVASNDRHIVPCSRLYRQPRAIQHHPTRVRLTDGKCRFYGLPTRHTTDNAQHTRRRYSDILPYAGRQRVGRGSSLRLSAVCKAYAVGVLIRHRQRPPK